MPTIKMVMFSTTNIHPYASLAAGINRRYCTLHGYDFVHEQYDDVRLSPSYEKVWVLREHLTTADHLLWVDADACVINFRQQIEPFCEMDRDLVIAGHEFGFDLTGRRVRYAINGVCAGLNAGVMLLRRSTWSREFLDEWWERCRHGASLGTAFDEQGQLQQMLVENALGLQSHIQLVTPCSRLNRCDDHGTDVCEFILHLWGSGSEFRQAVFAQISRGARPEIGISMPFFDVGTP